jgi:hypothetical protein
MVLRGKACSQINGRQKCNVCNLFIKQKYFVKIVLSYLLPAIFLYMFGILGLWLNRDEV